MKGSTWVWDRRPEEASSFPAPVYRQHVLAHVFADAQRMFLPALIEVDYAHLLMLCRQKIVSRETTAACLRALDGLDQKLLGSVAYDGSVEDLFFLVERSLVELAGADDAGRLHTARSRNDIDVTMYRMALRDRLLQTMEAGLRLRAVLLGIAMQHRAALMPAYTHHQPAQPTTLGHYLMAFVETLERDAERIFACYRRVNRSPLGACAITTTGFPIDRGYTAELLGFQGLIVNSYGAIASVDYVAEACSVLATAMLSFGRFTQDMLLWSTAEFGFLRLSEGYVQISSIMPQKRNPVPLEHARILASRALTESQAVLGSLHNTPFADMNDAEDSLQPLVALAFADAERGLSVLAGALSEAEFDTEHMRERAGANFLSVTEVADTLVRETGIPFQRAHAVVAEAVQCARSDDPERLADDLLRCLDREGIALARPALLTALDPEHFVAVRRVAGGPALEALSPEIDRAERQLGEDTAAIHAEQARLAGCHQRLHAEADRLIA